MSIYQSAVKKPITTALVFVGLAIMGVFSLTQIPVDLYPEIETNTIMVLTTYQGASASDIENNVSKPLENNLNSVSNLKTLTSNSKENISIITLEFDYGIDIEVATNDVRDKLDAVSAMLPEDAENPIIFKFGTDDIPILLLSATAKESSNALYKILDDKVVNPLARVNGVGTVSISGAPTRELQVYCDPYKLEAYGISIETVAGIIGQENKNTPAGSIDVGSNTYSLRVEKEFEEASQMLDLVVGSHNGRIVYLRDVARVEDALQERSQETFINGVKGATVVVQKQSGANSVNISKAVKDKLPEIQKTLPSDIQLDVIIDTSDNILNTISSLQETIMITFIVVMAVVFLFLGRWRATFIIMLTIPISLLASLIYLLATDNTLNIISLSSLSIAIGMVVDDAIVVLENITTHIEKGSRPKQAAVYATNEVAISVVASTLTMLAVFLPLTMLEGMAGILFQQLGWIVSIIMIVSTVAALTLIPMASSRMLKQDVPSTWFHRNIFNAFDRFLRRIDGGYGKVLNWAIHHKLIVVSVTLAALVGSVMFLAPNLKVEFFPTQDNARIRIDAELLVGTEQSITRELALELSEDLAKEHPEIESISVTEGSADSDNVWASLQDNGTHIIAIDIRLSSVEDRERGLTEICDEIRIDLKEYPQLAKFAVIAGGNQGGMGGEATVDVEIYGFDLDDSDKAAAEVAEAFGNIKGVNQVNISRSEYTPEYQVDFDREKLATHGLNVSTASNALRNRINGVLASYYREDGDEYEIRVRFAPEYRKTVEDIENIIIYNSLGKGVRVRDLGKVVETYTPPTIERKDRERVITVSAVVPQGMAMSDLLNETYKMMDNIDLPDGLFWELGGMFEDQQDTYSDMMMLMALIIVLVFIVMASQFESLTYPFVIMFSIPFAIIGVLLGLVLTNTPMSIMGMVGLIMLMGIVVKNGIVLIDYIILCRERGMGVANAVITSGKSRLRPVLMTTLTTVLGMFPMAFGTGEGSEMWTGMGMTVIWGLSISTIITLIIVPVMYSVFASRGVKVQRKKSLKAATALLK